MSERNVYDILEERGMIAQTTNAEAIRKLLGEKKVTFYIGFDPTADSLHIGHFLQLMVIAHMQRAGHMPIAILGGGTAMIGDPTGKTDMRKMMTPETIQHNADCFKSQMRNIVDFSEGKGMMINNADWIMGLNYVNFLREVGIHFTVNKMLSYECFKTRLERGLSFIEFNYMLMQSYDFLKLYQDYGCQMELGGDDQWANIIGGIELIRRSLGKDDAYGMTFRLLTTSDGKKMGKTEKGAIWLDPNKTSPYEFFQYWRNIADADVINCMKMLTFVPMEEINEMAKLEGSQLNSVKERLAYEVTKLIHGDEEADKALAAAKAVFGGGENDENMPSTDIAADMLTDGEISVVDLLVATGIAGSKGQAKRLIEQGGIAVDGEKAASFTQTVKTEQFEKGYVILRKGKKVYHKAVKTW